MNKYDIFIIYLILENSGLGPRWMFRSRLLGFVCKGPYQEEHLTMNHNLAINKMTSDLSAVMQL